MNYIKSENYRLLRKKGLYITSIIGLLSITAAAFVLRFFGEFEQNFPYATSIFFYANVISSNILILVIAFLFNLALTGRDMSVVKQSISFGVSRNTIFWSKLILTLSYFLLICLVGMLLMIGLGENLLETEEQSIRNFVIAGLNMLPIVLSGFFIIHMLKMLRVRDVYIIFILLFLYNFSGDLLRLILRAIPGLNELYQFAPDTLLHDNLMSFMDYGVQFDFRYWVTGIVISVVALLIGTAGFAKQNIE